MTRSIDWQHGTVVAVDQRALPHKLELLHLRSPAEVVDAVQTLAIRGASAIGVAGALGVALSARQHTGPRGAEAIRADAAALAGARPTAVTLAAGVARALRRLPEGADAVVAEAQQMVAEDEDINRRVAMRTAQLVRTLCGEGPLRVLTHCNTGRFATVAGGTALGAIKELAEAGSIDHVLVTETRPLLQGARLTAFELREAGIPHLLCVDSAAPAAISRGLVDCVLVGADRVAANGDVANKIGTYGLAVAAHRHGVPFIVAAPEGALDPAMPDGASIEIEDRPADEVRHLLGRPTCQPDTAVFNPAFDVTPAELITAVVSENRTLPAHSGRTRAPVASTRPGLRCITARDSAAAALIELGSQLYQRGWMEATSGNLSVRLPGSPDRALITASGVSKGSMTPADFVEIDIPSGVAVDPTAPRPSAETAIHMAVYRALPDCHAVVHAHPPHSTAAAGIAHGASQSCVRFHDFEMIKGLGPGFTSQVAIPVLENSPDVADIATKTAHLLATVSDAAPALLIANHGATAWGATLDTARNRLECLEALCLQSSLIRDAGGSA